MTRMRIVQWENQPERCQSAEHVVQRMGCEHIVVGSAEAFRSSLESGPVALVLASDSVLAEAVAQLSALEKAEHRHIPLIALVSSEDKSRLLATSDLRVFDVVDVSEPDRLPFSVTRAVTANSSREALKLELEAAKELLLSCQKSVAIGRLLASIAHEINNPLEAISNLLFLGQRNLSNLDEVARCLRMAEEELQRVGDITKQMLHFHRDTKTLQEVRLEDVLESIVSLYRNRLEMRQIEIVRQYRSQASILAHPGELRQALSNLVANAIDAMPRGGRLTLRLRDTHHCKPSVTIADQGQGIEPEALPHLGELLFTTKGEGGTGFGLWVTYQILKKYGASVRVYSSTRLGRSGTAFMLCFSESNSVVVKRENANLSEMSPRHPSTRSGRDDRGSSEDGHNAKTA
jgi:two-component system, NtrC family, sensor kinase